MHEVPCETGVTLTYNDGQRQPKSARPTRTAALGALDCCLAAEGGAGSCDSFCGSCTCTRSRTIGSEGASAPGDTITA